MKKFLTVICFMAIISGTLTACPITGNFYYRQPVQVQSECIQPAQYSAPVVAAPVISAHSSYQSFSAPLGISSYGYGHNTVALAFRQRAVVVQPVVVRQRAVVVAPVVIRQRAVVVRGGRRAVVVRRTAPIIRPRINIRVR